MVMYADMEIYRSANRKLWLVKFDSKLKNKIDYSFVHFDILNGI